MTNWKPFLALVLILCTILVIIFREVIWAPNDYLFAPLFDGIKNYYTFIYYILYDEGIHFSGMNYPFGEHIVFTDNQPLFAYPLQLFNKYVWDISSHLVGIFNYILVLSFVLGGILIYKILLKCLLPPWYSVITTICIVFLAQQFSMLGPYYGAYALSYTWAIPLQWLLLIKTYENKTDFRWVIAAGFLFFLIGLIHPYYYLFGFLLVIFCLFFYIISLKSGTVKPIKFINYQAFLALFPLLAFKLLLYFSDQITDRPQTPTGLYEFVGKWNDIFYPWNSFLGRYLQPLIGFQKSESNGYGYIGIVGIFCGLYLLFKLFSFRRKKKYPFLFKLILPFPLSIAFWPSFAILLFSLGFPFRLGLDFLYEVFSFLKQFRVLSRFLWIFYYVFSVFSAFTLFQVFRFIRINGCPKLALLFLIFFLSSWAIEAKINVSETALLIRRNKVANHFLGEKIHYKSILKTTGHNISDFQAILPFPYFTAGSEKITFQPLTAMPFAMAASIQTGLPLINGMMSRTSLKQSLATIQLISSDFIPKILLRELPNTKPLLLILVKDKLQIYEKNLILKSQLLYQNDTISLYKLPLKAFEATAANTAYNYFKAKRPVLVRKKIQNKMDLGNNFFYSSFNKLESSKWLFQKGALSAKEGPLIVFNGQIPHASSKNELYYCSIWVNLGTKSPPGLFKYYQFDDKNRLVDAGIKDIGTAVDIYRDWVNISFPFHLKKPENKIKLQVTGQDIIVDELLIRPENLNLYWEFPENIIVFNNYRIH